RPWGYAGGQPGRRTELVINEGSDRELRPTVVDVIALRPGDTVTLLTAGAGGYGHPFERDLAAVRHDVIRGKVTTAGAASDYGVVIAEDGTVDVQATEALRMSGACPSGMGPEREWWDEIFSPDLYDRMVSALFARDDLLRHERKREVIDPVLELLPAGFPRTRPRAAERSAATRLFSTLVRELVSEVEAQGER
ncbi:MAG: hydantoinase B/oxoprolinase family protein, partial [Actinobacteria bacterium]|nr:hydantoinase B/oxoprolinase family protein [Actinomycetota bacterium]